MDREGEYEEYYESDFEDEPLKLGDLAACDCPQCGARMENDDGLFWCENCMQMYTEQELIDQLNGY